MNAGQAFTLGGIDVPFRAALGHTQQIETLGASVTRRTISGGAIKQTVWRGKKRITLAGTGWAPVGVDEIDYTGQLTLKCAIPVAVRSNAASITLPTTRRSDSGYEPIGRAHLASGEEVETSVALVGDVATCSTVSGAVSYAVWYWPQFIVFADEPTQTGDAGAAEFGWQIVCEEV